MTDTKHLWLVEDDDSLRESLRQFLASDFDVTPLTNVKSAKAALQRGPEHRPDVALLDLSLPDGNGLELIGPIKKAMPTCVVLVLSGQLDLGAAKKAVALGADDYILKSDQLIQEILIRIPMAKDRGLLLSHSEPRIPQNEAELSPQHFEHFVQSAERKYFSSALKITNGSAARLAHLIGLGRSTVFKKLSDLGVSRKDLA